jgi:hypothetical protein
MKAIIARTSLMYEPNKDFQLPPLESKLWRYMDLTKLLGIIAPKTLWFSHVGQFQDKYEGYVPVPSLETIQEGLGKTIDKLNRFDPTEVERQKYTGLLLSLAPNIHRANIAKRQQTRDTLYVNCWHINDYESAAMWNLYLSSSEGVAIQSTVQRLMDTFRNADRQIHIGKVKYMDFEKSKPLFDRPLTFGLNKRMSFVHEQELRAVYLHTSETNVVAPGYDIPIDPEILIENVYVAPTSPSWIKPLIKSVLEKYGLKRDPIQSSLADGPVW